MSELRNEIPGLPPRWHGADYAARRISDIANRPPGAVRQVINDDIDWLLEEIAWLNQQLADRAAPPAIIHVSGELDEATLEKFRRELAEALAGPPARLRAEWAAADGQAFGQARARVAELKQLVRDILAEFHPTGDGHRARAGQVQIGKWQAVLDGEPGE